MDLPISGRKRYEMIQVDPNIVWAAGFFDGEGCIMISMVRNRKGQNPSHFLRLVVTNTHREPIEMFRRIFRVGSIEERPAKGVRKPYYVWTAKSKGAVKALTAMRPWIRVKEKEADLALDFAVLLQATKRRGNRRLPIETVAQRDAYHWALRAAKLKWD